MLEAEDYLENSLPETFLYLKAYQKELSNRSTYKARLSKYAFYHIYNVGEYSFSPYKVMWAEQSGTFKAAVCSSEDVPLVGKRPYVPDHKVYFVDCSSKEMAYYLCGLLNCSLVKNYIESHTISIQVSNVFKHLELPRFDSEHPDSKRLAVVSESLHYIDKNEPEFQVLLREADALALIILN